MERLKAFPELRDVASDLQNGGLKETLVIDRDSASRFGITPQAIDDTLYDSFGQRLVSTIFTQLNQYHVVLEVDPRFQTNPGDLQKLVELGRGRSARSRHRARSALHPPCRRPPSARRRRCASRRASAAGRAARLRR